MTSRVRINGHTLDIERAELRDPQGNLGQLRPRALALLVELARRPGEVVTKRDLMIRVWPGTVVTDDSLVQCVVEIRRELGDARQRIVRTIPRRGYQLITDADPASESPGATVRPWYRGRGAAFAALGLAALTALGALGMAGPWRDEAGDRGPITLAVLPLRQIDESTGAVAADGLGLAYMISGELARNADLQIVSVLATAEMRTKGMSVRDIGATTGARYLVDGTVERIGDRLGLELQVVETRTARVAWSGRFEPTAQEWPGVTQVLIERIGGSLGSTVRELRLSASLSHAPSSLDAQALTLHGIGLSQRPGAENLRRARRELEQATHLDDHYAPAWAHLGFVKSLLIFSRSDPTLSPSDLDQAVAEIRKAIALDPLLPSSWRLLSIAIDSGARPEEAVQAAERAVELGPGDPDNWLALGLAQYHAGRTEAGLRSVEKAVSWSRLPTPVYAAVEARLRYAVRDYPTAVRKARECMERAPVLVVCKAIWLSAQIRSGHSGEAEREWPRLVTEAPPLRSYRYAPRNTTEARAIDEDLDRLRAHTVAAAP